ncbi:MAG: alpha/beta fold hydrolase [Proteobacteria bacterium]|nr:alpha/beta fold hydrolase [Pseudomonadota bacterium]
MWAWLSSPAAWTLSRAGSLPWRPELRPAAEALARDLAATDPDAFARALEAEARRGFAAFVEGVLAYRRHPYRRALAEPPVLWSEGSTRLLDYGAVAPAARAPALIVPSLVNRAYVLDLAPGASLLRFLAGRGVRPLLVDWGAPGAGERAFTLGDYVAGRLSRALDRALALAGGPLPVVGYCMGGNLALALAARRRNGVAALALLATPWDFHAGLAIPPASVVAIARALEPAIELFGELPVDALQALFAALDPKAVARKFHAFAGLDPGSARARAFVALEDWLNDGVALVGPVARETLIGWYGENTPARGAWRIAGRAVRPEEVRAPALVALPEGDRIVPPPSAEALAAALPGATTLRVAAGHIGMVVGRRARAGLWRPLADWLLAQSRAAKSAPCA